MLLFKFKVFILAKRVSSNTIRYRLFKDKYGVSNLYCILYLDIKCVLLSTSVSVFVLHIPTILFVSFHLLNECKILIAS